MAKLTKAMREQLTLMSETDVYDVTNESVVRALERRGLAQRYVERTGHLANRPCWRITPAGRAAALTAQGEQT